MSAPTPSVGYQQFSSHPGYGAPAYQAAPYQVAPATSVPGGYGINPPAAVQAMPTKYVVNQGVPSLNPEYVTWQAQHQGPATTVPFPREALPVVSNMDDFMALSQVPGANITFTTQTTQLIQTIQEPEFCTKVGIPASEIVDRIGAVFAKYEISIGLLNKLMKLTEFDGIEFIMDDSGSMMNESDTVDMYGNKQTRWSEARSRLKEMIEILAYVPIPSITIRFLNRDITIHLKHDRHHLEPENFIQYTYGKIDEAFFAAPSKYDLTPAKTRLEYSLHKGKGKAIARYFFGDGEPREKGCDAEWLKTEISRMVKDRHRPARNPITFISCTNEDEEVEWMKDIEEVAPYCAELDDFSDECREVLKDQGHAFPFTRGFHLLAQLVAAMCPEDLDAMDESVPFTKAALDNLLGIQGTPEAYQHYFQCFANAQNHRLVESSMDQVRKSMNWMQHYHEFLNTPSSKDIQAVQYFKQELARASRH